MNRNLLISIILFFSWTFSFSLLNLLLIFFIKDNFKIKSRNIFFIVLSISLFCFINLIIGFDNASILNEGSSSLQLYIPYLSLLIFALLIGQNLNNEIFKYLILFTAFECFIIFIQFISGSTGFFYNSYEMNNEVSDLIYYRRPNGLSTNSSIVGQKILVSIWFLINTKFINFKYKKIIYLLLILGLVLTFNRTVILTLVISFFVFTKKVSKRIKFYSLIIVTIISTLFSNFFINQFLRGSVELNLEEFTRYKVFNSGLEFISNNPIFGNYSVKYFYEYGGRLFHLHNSYLQTLSSNGIPISILVLFLIIVLLKKRNTFLLPFLIYSIFQYGLFWGLSILDILIFYKNEKNHKIHPK